MEVQQARRKNARECLPWMRVLRIGNTLAREGDSLVLDRLVRSACPSPRNQYRAARKHAATTATRRTSAIATTRTPRASFETTTTDPACHHGIACPAQQGTRDVA